MVWSATAEFPDAIFFRPVLQYLCSYRSQGLIINSKSKIVVGITQRIDNVASRAEIHGSIRFFTREKPRHKHSAVFFPVQTLSGRPLECGGSPLSFHERGKSFGATERLKNQSGDESPHSACPDRTPGLKENSRLTSCVPKSVIIRAIRGSSL